MTIIVENGSIVNGANSYISETDLTNFANDRGITISGDKEQLIIQAMDYIESLQYKGMKQTRDQSLQWPRVNVSVDGYYLNANYIPNELKNGTMQTALAIDAGKNPQQSLVKNVKRKRVKDLEIEYMPGSVTNSIDIKIKGFLWKLLAAGGSGGNVINVSKG